MIREHTSSFNALDLLNQAAALAQGGATEVRAPKKPPTKFENVVNSLNSFLTTATGTIITVDGIINGPKITQAGYQSSTGNQVNSSLPTAQQVVPDRKNTANYGKVALWGAVGVGGSLLAYKLLSTNKKSVQSHE